MILWNDTKLTANEAAKKIVYTMGSSIEFWYSNLNLDVAKLTIKEEKDINICVERQVVRVCGFLNIEQINNKESVK